MNAEFKAWLLSHGFRQIGTSCLFTRLFQQTKWTAVWFHKNGGQAEIRAFNDGLVCQRLARLKSWKSIEELQEFFGKELE